MKKVVVVGAGASGMMAAIIAARNGHQVQIFEKNEKPGKKLYITGKGRCNLTNDCDTDTFYRQVMRNPRFLFSSYHAFKAQDTMEFFQNLKLPIKTERGNRVFPCSDKSSDVIRALELEMKRLDVKIDYQTKVHGLLISNQRFYGVELENGTRYIADACIIATGGLSYPSTGSTGDGYRFAEQSGHTVTACFPALTAIRVREKDVGQLQGLSLKNVALSVTTDESHNGKNRRKELFREQGEMLFTSDGMSGPLVLTASSILAGYRLKTGMDTMNAFSACKLHLDLKPALSSEQMEQRVLRDFQENTNKQFRNSLGALLPARMAEFIITRSGIDPYIPVNRITQVERNRFCSLLKNLSFQVEALGGYNEAVITCGGVSVKEINPTTMESKLVSGLYFTGEVLDLDALTGGFNLQIAWTTGYAAGSAIK